MGFLILRSSAENSAWQLDAGHFQASGKALEVQYPKADGTTQAYAFHKRFPTGKVRYIPVVPAYGSPPYHFTLSGTVPTGATISNTPGMGYGKITIPAQGSTGSGTMSVRVQDQAGGDITISWAWACIDIDDTDYFIHLSDVAGGSETGDSSNPFHDLGQILTTSTTDATWQGRQIIVRGTHVLSGLSAPYSSNGSRLRFHSTKPLVLVADYENGATWQGSASNADGAHFNVESGTDLAIVGFNWENPLVTQNTSPLQLRNCFIDTSSAVFKYGLLFDNTFDLTTTAGSSGSNSCVLFLANNPSYDGFVTIVDNHYLNGQYLGPFTCYDTHDMAVVYNEMSNMVSGVDGFFWKGGDAIEDVWCAFNYGTGNSSGFSKIQAIDFGDPTPSPPYYRGPIYFMHNQFVTSGLGIWCDAFTDFVFEVVSKRNNWKIANHYFKGSNLIDSGSSWTTDYDAIEHSGTYTQGLRDDGAGATISRGSNSNAGTSGILNDTTGAQDSPDGTVGAEIS